MDINSKIYIAGHNGMVGSAILRKLKDDGYTNIIHKNSFELNLKTQKKVQDFMVHEMPDYVFLAAAKVGGIMANNKYRADFLYDNLMIQNNVIDTAQLIGAKLLFLGSSCIYPKNCPQPIKEEYLLTGSLEPTNEPYAIAKIAGIKMCEAYRAQYGSNFISLMPTNLYGPNDNYDPFNSHVLPALLSKFHNAKVNGDNEVTIWGTGTPRREFLHVDDLADACIMAMKEYNSSEILNVGTGVDITIQDLALMIADIVGFTGTIINDTSKPDGTMRKLLDVSKINEFGWKAKIGLREGITEVYSTKTDVIFK